MNTDINNQEQLPPSCGPANTLDNETLVQVLLEHYAQSFLAGPSAEEPHARWVECKAEVLSRLAASRTGTQAVEICTDMAQEAEVKHAASIRESRAWKGSNGLANRDVDYYRGRCEALREAERRIAALAAAQWQPIESAPKDGTEIVCWAKHFERPCFLVWKTNSRIAQCAESQLAASYFGDPDEMDDYYFARTDGGPTHWMPLPPAPDAAPLTSYNAVCPVCESPYGFNEPEPLDKLYAKWEAAIRRECRERVSSAAPDAAPVAGRDPFNVLADNLEYAGFQNVVADGPQVTFYFHDQQYEVRAATPAPSPVANTRPSPVTDAKDAEIEARSAAIPDAAPLDGEIVPHLLKEK